MLGHLTRGNVIASPVEAMRSIILTPSGSPSGTKIRIVKPSEAIAPAPNLFSGFCDLGWLRMKAHTFDLVVLRNMYPSQEIQHSSPYLCVEVVRVPRCINLLTCLCAKRTFRAQQSHPPNNHGPCQGSWQGPRWNTSSRLGSQ